MNDRLTIQTNLGRAVTLGVIAILVSVVFYLINSNAGTLIILAIVLGVFSQYILSKKIFRIIIDKEKVKFEYLQLKKKAVSYERDLVKIKKRSEVYFRGGKNEVFEIYNKITGKKIFEINKRSFKCGSDHIAFKTFFKIND